MVRTLCRRTAARFFSLWSLGALAACASHSAPQLDYGRSDLYFGFTLVDPTEERVRENAYLIVTDGRIAAIGEGEPPNRVFRSRRDFTGRYALPGLVDAHAHITAGPTTVERVNGAPVIRMESVDEITQYHARVALAFGVTTVRNPAGIRRPTHGTTSGCGWATGSARKPSTQVHLSSRRRSAATRSSILGTSRNGAPRRDDRPTSA